MSRLIEKSLDELCANTVDTVDRIMGRYGAALEEACAMAGITAIDYSEWKEHAPSAAEQAEPSEEEKALHDQMLEKIVMHKIPDLLKLGITLENACEFARISVEEYEEYKKSH